MIKETNTMCARMATYKMLPYDRTIQRSKQLREETVKSMQTKMEKLKSDMDKERNFAYPDAARIKRMETALVNLQETLVRVGVLQKTY